MRTGSWSASTSPARSPSPTSHNMHTSRSGNTGHGPTRSNRGYGTTSLCQRSRSPSPSPTLHSHTHGPPTIGTVAPCPRTTAQRPPPLTQRPLCSDVAACAVVGLNQPMQHSSALIGNVQHSYPVLGGRRGQGRRLPPTPCKPSTLQLRPANINFPKLNASPTHVSFSAFVSIYRHCLIIQTLAPYHILRRFPESSGRFFV